MARRKQQFEFKGGSQGITKGMVDGWISRLSSLDEHRTSLSDDIKEVGEEIKDAGVALDMLKFAYQLQRKNDPAIATAKAECLIMILEQMGILDSLFSQRSEAPKAPLPIRGRPKMNVTSSNSTDETVVDLDGKSLFA